MAIITLLSDWGDTDYYVAAVKGRILQDLPNATIVDITHKIPHFNTREAAYVLRHAYHHFPKGTIHIIGVNTEESLEEPHLAVLYDGHYFIGADNGIFSLIFEKEKKPEKVYSIEIPQDSEKYTFSGLHRFAKAAVLLAQGENIETLGAPYPSLQQKLDYEPSFNHSGIRGMVIHIDPYNNAITNISRELFERIIGKKPFTIYFKGYSCEEIGESYADAGGEANHVCLFGSNDLLEIALKNAEAASLMGLQVNDPVIINILPDQI
ncbi:SAM-dependent chlorinase/fluorinase [Candidatus Sulfidibacterium hydrothermale]|uniref:SAM hydrolase/SAM-dependent halogenase family protein n=1 Tax=Candidatus Sulfidibacterium hydrothermale TaxID=2875962 RepID=UPI001F0A5C4F|nr:SAM-dependent chlorinase/fluorinase [Candidatus Sulfidibacterium hydrothermale]UBM62567.1 SAM-dependent chlorinase/fluorinase [Candidatus Sulfidibacterium hydrothermale]